MRIVRINVTKLFGIFDHDIPISNDDRIRIIHGPNGYGKTMILTMVEALFSSKYSTLRSIPFQELCLQFDDGSSLSITKVLNPKEETKEIRNSNWGLLLKYSKNGKRNVEHEFSVPNISRSRVDFPLGIISDVIPELDRIGPQMWLSLVTNEQFSLDEVMERFGDVLPDSSREKGVIKEPEWLRRVKDAIHITFVQTERLLSYSISGRVRRGYEGLPRRVPAVSEYSRELAQSIQKNLQNTDLFHSHEIELFLSGYSTTMRNLI